MNWRDALTAIEYQKHARTAHKTAASLFDMKDYAEAVKWQKVGAEYAKLSRGFMGLTKRDYYLADRI